MQPPVGGFWTIYFKSLVTKLLSWLTRTRSEYSWFLPTKALIASSFWLRGWTCFHFSILIHPLQPPSKFWDTTHSYTIVKGFGSYPESGDSLTWKNAQGFSDGQIFYPPQNPSSGPKTGAASSRGGEKILCGKPFNGVEIFRWIQGSSNQSLGLIGKHIHPQSDLENSSMGCWNAHLFVQNLRDFSP